VGMMEAVVGVRGEDIVGILDVTSQYFIYVFLGIFSIYDLFILCVKSLRKIMPSSVYLNWDT
jgi:hypothetical protein